MAYKVLTNIGTPNGKSWKPGDVANDESEFGAYSVFRTLVEQQAIAYFTPEPPSELEPEPPKKEKKRHVL